MPVIVLAQSALFTEYTINQVQLSSEDQAWYQNLSDTNFSRSVRIVSTADVQSIQEDGFLQFLLPGLPDTLIAEATQIDENERVGFQWFGKWLNHSGYLMFNVQEGKSSGYFLIDGDIIDLLPLDSTYQFLVQRNTENSTVICGTPPDAELPPDVTPPTPDCDYDTSYNSCPALITVLILYDEHAKQYLSTLWGGPGLFFRFGEAMVNQAFYNSDIPNKEIRVDFIEKDSFAFSTDPDIDIRTFQDLNELKDWSVQERGEYAADLVILLTGDHYTSVSGFATLEGAPSYEKAFAIIESGSFLEGTAFPHELGHLFGCRHNWPLDLGNDSKAICAHAYRSLSIVPSPDPNDFSSIYSWRTLVGRPLDIDYFTLNDEIYYWHESWILHHSNPYVKYNSIATGRPPFGAVTDNAQQIRNSGCTVADFFPNQELSVFISYTPGCDSNITFTANIIEPESGLPGGPPYTVEWYVSRSGLFQYPNQGVTFLGTGQTLPLTEQPGCPIYWIKCIVRSTDGTIVSRIIKVDLSAFNCSCDRHMFTSLKSDGSIRIFPNPATGNFLTLDGSGIMNWSTYQIWDVNGRLYADGVPDDEAYPPSNLQIPISGLKTGVYFLRLFFSDSRPAILHKLVILK